jgi:nucleoside-diphosphate-sugar epimerase
MSRGEAGAVLVTGAGGFVGGHVVDHLRGAGTEVVGLPGRWATADDLDVAVGDRPVSHCIHLAWHAGHADYLTNIDANLQSLTSSLELVRWLDRRKVPHLVVAGTCAEYGAKDAPHTEDDPPEPSSPYAEAKVELWRILRSGLRPPGLTVAWARLFNLTGPGEHPDRLLPSVVRSLAAGQPIDLSAGDQRRDYLDVADAASALSALALHGSAGTYNVCSGRAVVLRDLLTAIGEQMGRVDLLHFGARPRGEHDPDLVAGDNSRLVAETGWRPRHDADAMIDRLVRTWAPDRGAHPA